MLWSWWSRADSFVGTQEIAREGKGQSSCEGGGRGWCCGGCRGLDSAYAGYIASHTSHACSRRLCDRVAKRGSRLRKLGAVRKAASRCETSLQRFISWLAPLLLSLPLCTAAPWKYLRSTINREEGVSSSAKGRGRGSRRSVLRRRTRPVQEGKWISTIPQLPAGPTKANSR
jgi:hypothetical protein